MKKIINLNNYVCDPTSWYVATQNIWDDMKNQNERLRRWLNPPPIEPLRYFFKVDAGSKGWTWTPALENCYGFLITYYANPNLIINQPNEPGGNEIIDTSKQLESPGMIPVNWNIPLLADLDRALSSFLESLGLTVPTWLAYLLIGSFIYIKVIK